MRRRRLCPDWLASSGPRRQPAWIRGVAAGLPITLVVLPVASRALPGDVQGDTRMDAADALMVQRAIQGTLVLSTSQRAAADVAPYGTSSGAPQPNGQVNDADLAVLLRAMGPADVDGDGLAGAVESQLGLSSLLRDTDGDGQADGSEDTDEDGVSNAAEILAGTSAWLGDTDGDGLVDGEDGDPLQGLGTEALWIHVDHLGSVSVVTDASGQVVRRIRYGVFGEIRSSVLTGPASTSLPAESYTGQRRDAEIGLAVRRESRRGAPSARSWRTSAP